jgi:hypothetical protein
VGGAGSGSNWRAPARLSSRITVDPARGRCSMFAVLIAFLLDVINEGPRIL